MSLVRVSHIDYPDFQKRNQSHHLIKKLAGKTSIRNKMMWEGQREGEVMNKTRDLLLAYRFFLHYTQNKIKHSSSRTPIRDLFLVKRFFHCAIPGCSPSIHNKLGKGKANRLLGCASPSVEE